MRFRREPLNHRRRQSVMLFLFYWLLATGYCLLLCSFPVLSQREVNSSATQRSQTPPPVGLNQWGAVTLFHGLPSDRVRAIAEDSEGAMWFGTDGGLAKYDGRRTQAIVGGDFTRGRVLLASEQGLIFDCRMQTDGSLITQTNPAQPLASADSDHPGPLRLTSLAYAKDTLLAGTLSRGLLAFERDQLARAKEVQSRPRLYFINALEPDALGRVWFGAKAKNDDSGLYQSEDLLHPLKIGSGIGTVVSLRADSEGGLWVGTDGRGVFHYDRTRTLRERFTFEGTAGGLRSDRVYSI